MQRLRFVVLMLVPGLVALLAIAAQAASVTYVIVPAMGPVGTTVTVTGSGCADDNSWLGHDGALAFYNNVGGNFSGAFQVPFDASPDTTFAFTFQVPTDGFSRDGTVLSPLPPGDYLTQIECPNSGGATATFTITTADASCTITGTEADDTLLGTPGDDIICGLGGNDQLRGNAGDDVLFGGPGNDGLFGEAGIDQLSGMDGDDDLRGGAGDDQLQGGEGTDGAFYIASPAAVLVDLANGSATGEGNDQLISIEGVRGSALADTLRGSASNDELLGGDGNDLIVGAVGDDLLGGGAGDDRIAGGPGDDLLVGGVDIDDIDGGDGLDTCYSAGGRRVRCELPVGAETDGRSVPPPPDQPTPDEGGIPNPPAALATTATEASVSSFASVPPVRYWYIGNSDYVYVYNAEATATVNTNQPGPSGWEGQICRFLKFSPATTACRINASINAVTKNQLRWMIYNAKKWQGCAVFIMDYGRHGVFQRRGWKARVAEVYDSGLALPYVTPGLNSHIRVSDPTEAQRRYLTVTC
jgi:RTX calcium-binding nonapeptide repeat (4 copies)